MAIERITSQDEVYEFLISQPTPEQIIAFRPSDTSQERMRYLLDANRNGTLTPTEIAELDENIHLENFMRRLKIHARQKLARS